VDEAFVPFHRMVVGLAAHADIRSEEHGIHMYVHRFSVETPIELDIVVAADGTVEIGSVPPLYRVDTSFRPSYHQIRYSAELADG
jgi:hypothetical protein